MAMRDRLKKREGPRNWYIGVSRMGRYGMFVAIVYSVVRTSRFIVVVATRSLKSHDLR